MSGPEEAENLHHDAWRRQQPEPNAGAPEPVKDRNLDGLPEHVVAYRRWAFGFEDETNWRLSNREHEIALCAREDVERQAAERIAALEAVAKEANELADEWQSMASELGDRTIALGRENVTMREEIQAVIKAGPPVDRLDAEALLRRLQALIGERHAAGCQAAPEGEA